MLSCRVTDQLGLLQLGEPIPKPKGCLVVKVPQLVLWLSVSVLRVATWPRTARGQNLAVRLRETPASHKGLDWAAQDLLWYSNSRNVSRSPPPTSSCLLQRHLSPQHDSEKFCPSGQVFMALAVKEDLARTHLQVLFGYSQPHPSPLLPLPVPAAQWSAGHTPWHPVP